MCSYKKEVLRDAAAYNAITVVMNSNQTDLAGAMQWLSNRHDEVVANFLKTKETILNHLNGFPLWGEDIDRQISTYVNALGGFKF